MKDRIRRWLHDHGHHQLCRVVVRKVVVRHEYDFSPTYLVGTNPDGSEQRIEMTPFGGRKVAIREWRAGHA